MIFDYQSFFFVVGFGIFISGLAILISSKFSVNSIRGGNYWGLGNISVFLGLLFLGLRGQIPDVISIFIGNIAILYSILFYYHALVIVTGKKFQSNIINFIPPISSVLILYFYFVQPDYSARSLISSATIIILILYCIRVILKSKTPDTLAPNLVMSLIFVGLIIMLTLQIILTLSNYEPTNTIITDKSMFFALSYSFVGIVLLSLEFVLLSNTINYLEIHKLAYKDFLTNTLSRRAIIDQINLQISQATRTNFPFSILLIDLDNLKFINDNYGHNKGDQALKHISSIISSSLRAEDFVGRLGGDEFVVVLANTNYRGAEVTSQRIIDNTLNNLIPFDKEVFISIGGAQFAKGDVGSQSIIDRADQALYEVKKKGGNDFKIQINESIYTQ